MKGGIWPVSLDGRPVNRAENQNAFLRYVTPGFFATLGIPIKSGRGTEEADTHDRQYVAVISESFVKRFWPNETPASVIGRTFTFAFNDRVVAGVAGDVKMRGLEREAEPQVYLPYKQVEDESLPFYAPKDLVIQASASPADLMPAVRRIIRNADPEQPISSVQTMTDILSDETATRSLGVKVLGGFAMVAFLLAGVGIHGLLSFAVSQRKQEIGVRIALGAQTSHIVRMIMGHSAVLAAIGIVTGLALAYTSGRAMEALLAGVKPSDPATFLSAIGLCLLMTLLGSLLPTLRAVRVDPMSAIRTE